MSRISLVLTLFLCSVTLVWSQDTGNPFDIKRTKTSASQDTSRSVDTVVLAKDTLQLTLFGTNGTDTPISTAIDSMLSADTISSVFQIFSDTLVPDTAYAEALDSNTEEETINESGETDDTSGMIPESIQSLSDQLSEFDYRIDNRILFGFSIGLLLFLGALLTINRSLIRKAYRAIANDNYLRFLYREYKSMPWMYWLFYLYFVLTIGFFLYLFVHYVGYDPPEGIMFLLGSILVVGTVYIVRHFSLQLMSTLFPVEKEAHLYSFVTMLLNILLGIIITPVNLVVAFGPPTLTQYMVWLGAGLILMIYLFRQLKGIFISGRFLYQNQFHFFLYLCTAEIAPLIIIVKLALSKLGVQ